MEALYLKELMETHDANEGINAFIQKRKPEWKNQ
jgi:cyclohexa-1,5-dienecarbonyl-CoA hydratase